MTRRAVRCVPVLALLAVIWPGPAAWSQEGVRWEPTIGFEGVYKQGAWTPVFVDVTNSGESRSGEIRLPVYENSYDGRRSVTYTVPVELPRNSRKRYTLYAPPEEMESIFLRLGRTTEARELKLERPASSEDTFIVVVGGESGLLRFLSGTPAAGRTGGGVDPYDPQPRGTEPVIEVGHAAWEGLPESWLGWEGVDAVVLGDAGFAAASPQALEALLQWLELGGTIIVPGGTFGPQMAISPVGGLLPLEISGTETAPDLGLLGEWVEQPLQAQASLLAEGVLRPDASVLCGTREDPLIARRPVGAGRMVLTRFDFTAAPVKYWDGQAGMWQRLLAQAPVGPSVTVRAEGGSMPYEALLTLGQAASYTPAAALPPLWLLLGFLGAYIIVLVPVNYGLLKRLDRRELAWVTTPLVVLAFTVGAYGVGYGMRGGSIVLNRLAIVEAAAGVGTARGHGYVGLFSPARRSYTVKLEGTAAGARDVTPIQERRRRGVTLREGPEPAITDIAMNMWTSRAFGVEFLADLQGGIDGAIEWDGRDLRATVENETGYRLRDCRVVRGNLLGQRKEVKSGATASWSFGRGSSVGDRWQGSGPVSETEVKDGMREIALRAMFGEQRAGMPAPMSAPRLLAAVEEPMVPVKLDRRSEVNDLGLVLVDLPLHLAAGAVVPVPNWMIARRVISTEGYFSAGNMSDPRVTISEGSAVYEFAVPLGKGGGEAVALSLGAPYEVSGSGVPLAMGGGRRRGQGAAAVQPSTTPGSGAGRPPLSVRAYNFEFDRWETLAGASPNVVFPSPGSYLSRDGRVLVQLEAASQNVRLQGLTMSAEVNAF